MGKLNVPFLVTSVVLVAVIVVFAVFGFNLSNKISDNTNAITSLDAKVAGLQSTLNTANSDISALKTSLSSASAQITSLQGDLATQTSKLASLQTQLGAANSQIASAAARLNDDESKLASLDSQLASVNSQISSLQDQINTLNNRLYTLSTSGTQILGSTTIAASSGAPAVVASFTASDAGYVTISGYSTSSTGYVYAVNSTYGNSSTYAFQTSATTVTIPIQPGTIYVYFGTADATAYAYITSVYYYHY